MWDQAIDDPTALWDHQALPICRLEDLEIIGVGLCGGPPLGKALADVDKRGVIAAVIEPVNDVTLRRKVRQFNDADGVGNALKVLGDQLRVFLAGLIVVGQNVERRSACGNTSRRSAHEPQPPNRIAELSGNMNKQG